MARSSNNLPIIAGALAVVVVAAIVGLFVLRSNQASDIAGATSNQADLVADFTVVADTWPGYGPLGSDTMRTKLAQQNIGWKFESDGGDYATRWERLRDGKVDLAAFTLDSFLSHSQDFNQGGVIVGVIDISKGGDALVCNTASTPSIKSADDLVQKDGWKIAFTPDSPSHHVLRGMGNDYGIIKLLGQGDWRVETTTGASEEALEKLQSGATNCAVMWQPHVFQALQNPDNVLVQSSQDVDKLVVDVLVVGRDLLTPSHPKNVYLEAVLDAYFVTQREFEKDEELRLREMRTFFRTYDNGKTYQDDEIRAMLDGVKWVNLTEQAESWYGVGGERPRTELSTAITYAETIIKAEKGDFLPAGFRTSSIIRGDYVKRLYSQLVITETNETVTDPLKLRFPELKAWQWASLERRGALRSQPVSFEDGSLELALASEKALGEAMSDFRHYPTFRLEVQMGYDIYGNVELGQNRAKTRVDTVRKYIIDEFDVDPNRIRVHVPPPEAVESVIPIRENESGRAYEARLLGVRLVLVREKPET